MKYDVTVINETGEIITTKDFTDFKDAKDFFMNMVLLRFDKSKLLLIQGNYTRWIFDLDARTPNNERWLRRINPITKTDELPYFVASNELCLKYGIRKKKLYTYTTKYDKLVLESSRLIEWYDFVKVQTMLYINENVIDKLRPLYAPKNRTIQT